MSRPVNFDTLDYLKTGNDRQKKAHVILTGHQIFEKLKAFNPMLAGTIPLAIDTESSDLDILCYCTDHEAFRNYLKDVFGHFPKFKTWSPGKNITLASFMCEGFQVEIFGQNIPVKKQLGYRHMLMEYFILQKKGTAFREQIIALKEQGFKTEPAFAKLLGLTGDPYTSLLEVDPDSL